MNLILLTTVLLVIFKRSVQLFNKPDLSHPYIPEPWRSSCGYRFQTINIKYESKCFKNAQWTREYALADPNIEVLENRVMNGNIAQWHESPWTVQLAEKLYSWTGRFSKFRESCTGVLITMRHILTAAHCYDPNVGFGIFAGNNRAFDKKFLVAQSPNYLFYRHPHFHKGDYHPNGTEINDPEFDIGVIILNEPIDYKEKRFKIYNNNGQHIINTICLPESSISWLPKYERATFFGWGHVSPDDSPTTFLMRGNVDAITPVPSKPYFLLHMVKFKGYDNTGRSQACMGDSGAGLVQYIDDDRSSRAVLIGIIKSSNERKGKPHNCNEDNIEQTWALKVSFYLEWINEVLMNTSYTE